MSPLDPFAQRLAASAAAPARAWLWLALLLLLCLPARAQQPDVRQYKVIIDAPAPLSGQLNESLPLTRYVREQNLPLDEFRRLAAAAISQISEVMATEGYFSAAVKLTHEMEGTTLVARFSVEPGARTVVQEVDIRFAGPIAEDPQAASRRERLIRNWRLKAGEPFTQKDWTEAKNEFLKNLLNRDYPAARISQSEARIDPLTQRAQLSVVADSGPAFTFGELQVQGLERYPRRIVDAQNTIRPGERYSQDKLTELQQRLLDTGYFKSAIATIDVDSGQPKLVPVRLDLSENEKRRLQLGGGISTDTGPRAQVRWLDRRFLDRDWRLESEARADRTTKLIGGELFFPRREEQWALNYTPSVAASFARTDISNEINDKIRTSARLTSPNRNDEKIWGVSFLIDRQRLPGLEPNDRQALVASWRYTRRRLDNFLAPRRGYVATVELSGGPAGLVNENNIGRVLVQAVWMSPSVKRTSLVLRGQLGQVFGATRQQVPDDLLFRTGGDQTVRGYGYNTLGVSQNGATVGGSVLAVLSAEAIYHFTPQWGGAVFTDAGNAADDWRGFRLARGSGVGARWRSPIGPVNLDLAYGHETRQPRIHFYLGYGF